MYMFNQLFKRHHKKSGIVAKTRLQKVVSQDRVKLSPGRMNHLRDDLVQVISKYVEIDCDQVNVALSDNNHHGCLTAHVPVLGALPK
ncbi:MAG: cell division topological specificity factor MinE [Anaerolineae bacterium]|nr:cell division topological specificity factor MinE [Anaerolineae bacterium]